MRELGVVLPLSDYGIVLYSRNVYCTLSHTVTLYEKEHQKCPERVQRRVAGSDAADLQSRSQQQNTEQASGKYTVCRRRRDDPDLLGSIHTT